MASNKRPSFVEHVEHVFLSVRNTLNFAFSANNSIEVELGDAHFLLSNND